MVVTSSNSISMTSNMHFSISRGIVLNDSMCDTLVRLIHLVLVFLVDWFLYMMKLITWLLLFFTIDFKIVHTIWSGPDPAYSMSIISQQRHAPEGLAQRVKKIQVFPVAPHYLPVFSFMQINYLFI